MKFDEHNKSKESEKTAAKQKAEEEKIRKEAERKQKEMEKHLAKEKREEEKRKLEMERKQKEQERILAKEKREEEKRKLEMEKLQKEQERILAKEKREEEKRKLEMERKQKEQERILAKEKREEEKRKLEMEKLQKEQERILAKEKREEAKRQHELEKIQKQEEKKAEEERRKQKFVKFFVKVDKKKEVEEPKLKKFDGYTPTFEIKKGMFLAPLHRRPDLTEEEKKELDAQLKSQCLTLDDLYVRQLTKGRRPPTIGSRTNTLEDSCSSEVILVDSSSSKKPKLRWKFLYFRENYRPPYFGTWRKKCPRLNGRRPFLEAYDSFDYKEDSDEEWESEPEDGEECKSDEEDADDKDSNADSDEDSFMVDHGYLSPDEEEESLNEDQEKNLDPETRRERMKNKAEAWKSEKLCRKWEKLKSFVVEPNYSEDIFCEFFRSFTTIVIEPTPIVVEASSSPTTVQKSCQIKHKFAKKRTSLNCIDAYCKPTAPKLARRTIETKISEANNSIIVDPGQRDDGVIVCLDD